MEQNTVAQNLLLRYCSQRGYQKVTNLNAASVRATDAKGCQRDLTVNVYGDVMDRNTGKVIADGNTSHDIRRIYELPTEWKDRKTSVQKSLGEKKSQVKASAHKSKSRSLPQR